MPKSSVVRLLGLVLALAPSALPAHLTFTPAVLQVAMPESWGLSDSLGFFALVVIILSVLVRRGVLRPNKFRK